MVDGMMATPRTGCTVQRVMLLGLGVIFLLLNPIGCAERRQPTAEELVSSFAPAQPGETEQVIPDYYRLRPVPTPGQDDLEDTEQAPVSMSDLTLEEYERIENSPVDWEQVVQGKDPAPKPWWLNSDSFQAPKLIRIPPLAVSRHRLRQEQAHPVILRVSLDRAGAVMKVAIMKSVGKGLDEACVDRVRQAEFTPATWNGVPMPFTVLLPCRVRHGGTTPE